MGNIPIQEVRRKLFHLVGLIYPLGLTLLSRKTFVLWLSAFLTVVLFLEVARLISSTFNEKLLNRFKGLFREEERTRFSGVFWMLAGVMWIALVVQSHHWAIAISLYVIFGDAAASLVGRWIGGPTWWRSRKTVAGSCACFVVCLILGLFFLSHVPWYLMALSAILATVAEAGVLPINDNFSIPIFASLVSGLG